LEEGRDQGATAKETLRAYFATSCTVCHRLLPLWAFTAALFDPGSLGSKLGSAGL